jgi:hypothetical protein
VGGSLRVFVVFTQGRYGKKKVFIKMYLGSGHKKNLGTLNRVLVKLSHREGRGDRALTGPGVVIAPAARRPPFEIALERLGSMM